MRRWSKILRDLFLFHPWMRLLFLSGAYHTAGCRAWRLRFHPNCTNVASLRKVAVFIYTSASVNAHSSSINAGLFTFFIFFNSTHLFFAASTRRCKGRCYYYSAPAVEFIGEAIPWDHFLSETLNTLSFAILFRYCIPPRSALWPLSICRSLLNRSFHLLPNSDRTIPPQMACSNVSILSLYSYFRGYYRCRPPASNSLRLPPSSAMGGSFVSRGDRNDSMLSQWDRNRPLEHRHSNPDSSGDSGPSCPTGAVSSARAGSNNAYPTFLNLMPRKAKLMGDAWV